jgi:hypothetical protein
VLLEPEVPAVSDGNVNPSEPAPPAAYVTAEPE